jgi:polyribonucleotide nucleotidyltransferase
MSLVRCLLQQGPLRGHGLQDLWNGKHFQFDSISILLCVTYLRLNMLQYDGITAMQLDVKRPLDMTTITNALQLAREGRRAILLAMEKECKALLPGLKPRASLKLTAPRVEIVRFDPNRKRDLVGPGGSVLRQLEDRFAVTLDLSQDGRCLIFGPQSSVLNARNVIMDLVSEVEEGGIYEGTVVEIKDFGAVIELLRNKEGLLHVSELTDTIDKHPGGNLGVVKEHLKVGDKIEVLCKLFHGCALTSED